MQRARHDPAAITVKVGGNALATLQTNASKQDKHDAKMHDIFELARSLVEARALIAGTRGPQSLFHL